ncbi:MAG: hypothetical protein WBW61_06585 [Rhodanobacteraceae bacterium]
MVPASLPLFASRQRYRTLMLLLFLVCALIYLRGLFGGFLFDDFGSIVDNSSLRSLDGSTLHWLTLALSSNAGILRRPLSMLSFGVDFSLFGLSPLAFKFTNLALHLFNGGLLYALAKRLVPRLIGPTDAQGQAPSTAPGFALVATALWLLHPLHVSGVVYIVQRMNLLATLFMFAGLLCYSEGRERVLRGERGLLMSIAGILLFGLLAVFSKENGALITAYAFVIEAICYRFAAPSLRQRRTIQIFFWATLALPVALFLTYIISHPQWLVHSYAARDFTLMQRLLSESRILCDYLLWIFVPVPSWMGIFHDDIAKSTGVLSPVTTLLAVLFLIALVIAAWMSRRRAPAFAFGVAWFLIGHSMESTILPLELVFEHRNYLPMAGLMIGVVCTIGPWLRGHVDGRRASLVAGACVAVLCALTAVRANTWGSALRLAMAQARDHPDSSRAQYEAGRQIIFTGRAHNQRDQAEREAIPYFERGKALDPTDLYAASSLILIHGRQNHQVDPAAIMDLAHRVKTIRLAQVNPFLVILTAATDGSIPLDANQMKLLVTSSLDNARLLPTMRAMILNDYGHYQFQIEHDNQSAVGLTLAAAAQDPQNPLFQINLTKLALAIGEPAKAAEHIAIAERLNKAGIYDDEIAALEQQVKNANSAPEN